MQTVSVQLKGSVAWKWRHLIASRVLSVWRLFRLSVLCILRLALTRVRKRQIHQIQLNEGESALLSVGMRKMTLYRKSEDCLGFPRHLCDYCDTGNCHLFSFALISVRTLVWWEHFMQEVRRNHCWWEFLSGCIFLMRSACWGEKKNERGGSFEIQSWNIYSFCPLFSSCEMLSFPSITESYVPLTLIACAMLCRLANITNPFRGENPSWVAVIRSQIARSHRCKGKIAFNVRMTRFAEKKTKNGKQLLCKFTRNQCGVLILHLTFRPDLQVIQNLSRHPN